MREMALREALTQTLETLAQRRGDLVVLTSDATGSASLDGFAERCPERLIEMGIAEQNEISVAAGLSTCGFTPFVCAPAAFLTTRALEQLKVDVDYSDTNVKIIGISGGVSYGATGATHHATSDLAGTLGLDRLTVLLPADAVQMAALVQQMADTWGPFYVRIGRNPVPVLYGEGESFPIGKAKLLRDGEDLTILSAGEVLFHALQAAEILAARGISARVLDLYSVKPIDTEAILTAARQTGRLLVAEEHNTKGGIGSLVCQIVAGTCCGVPVRCLGIPTGHAIAGTSAELFHYYGLDAEGIARAAQTLVGAPTPLSAAAQ
ncbi:transketolase family protein [Feifania hominis]|uniref:Transketolase family protein n=1 Tax=Feifania hominis TaxID=2763660 RepID=A0A926DG32_9FIRM|nr:transketolase C-terminal domain-containing protein [Feifania hominis]MBC8536400.1 transketolase family protein [Feifania hominis]